MAKSTKKASLDPHFSRTPGVDIQVAIEPGPATPIDRMLIDDQREYVLMPESAEQTSLTLRPEDEQRAMARLVQAHTQAPVLPMLDFLATERMPPPPSSGGLMGASALPSGRRRVVRPPESGDANTPPMAAP